ncbi:hypothetical protein COO91_09750 (plasmid) [Nostoc flagelliforme CCNUN1]|uniref:Uncharacterized protein n=1 Tax=Nostoc flagelliforme CCNUN1 TaxID=2038116 RepID=A0A2K8T7E6_9NOSO|nr:hypothetical protein COO91_09750 [Nostoc flagelliforme CCNUN1]
MPPYKKYLPLFPTLFCGDLCLVAEGRKGDCTPKELQSPTNLVSK